MNTFSSRCLAALLLAGVSACGASATRTSSGSGDMRMLTLEQIEASSAANALDLVRTLRPAWLQKRGRQSLSFEGDIMVYIDHMHLGSVHVLRSIPVTGINRIEFYDATTATQRWGTGHLHGAIAIFTRN